jgi:hypothetical protein
MDDVLVEGCTDIRSLKAVLNEMVQRKLIHKWDIMTETDGKDYLRLIFENYVWHEGKKELLFTEERFEILNRAFMTFMHVAGLRDYLFLNWKRVNGRSMGKVNTDNMSLRTCLAVNSDY